MQIMQPFVVGYIPHLLKRDLKSLKEAKRKQKKKRKTTFFCSRIMRVLPIFFLNQLIKISSKEMWETVTQMVPLHLRD